MLNRESVGRKIAQIANRLLRWGHLDDGQRIHLNDLCFHILECTTLPDGLQEHIFSLSDQVAKSLLDQFGGFDVETQSALSRLLMSLWLSVGPEYIWNYETTLGLKGSKRVEKLNSEWIDSVKNWRRAVCGDVDVLSDVWKLRRKKSTLDPDYIKAHETKELENPLHAFCAVHQDDQMRRIARHLAFRASAQYCCWSCGRPDESVSILQPVVESVLMLRDIFDDQSEFCQMLLNSTKQADQILSALTERADFIPAQILRDSGKKPIENRGEDAEVW